MGCSKVKYTLLLHVYLFISCKSKLRPGTGNEGPEAEWRCSSTLSLTAVLDVGEWLTPHLGRFTLGKETL